MIFTHRFAIAVGASLFIVAMLAGCGQANSSPSPTPTRTATARPAILRGVAQRCEGPYGGGPNNPLPVYVKVYRLGHSPHRQIAIAKTDIPKRYRYRIQLHPGSYRISAKLSADRGVDVSLRAGQIKTVNFLNKCM